MMLDAMLEQMLVTGEVESGWEQTGTDILAYLDSKTGGRAENLLYEADPEVPNLIDLSGSPSPVPDGMYSYRIRPEPAENVDERTFMGLLPGYILEASFTRRPVGNALCYDKAIGVVIHASRPAGEWEDEDAGMLGMIYGMVERIADEQVCMIYDLEEDGTISSRAFTPDGRPYITMNSEMGMSVLIDPDRRADLLASWRDYREEQPDPATGK